MSLWRTDEPHPPGVTAVAVLVAISMVSSALILGPARGEDDERVLRIGFLGEVDSLNPNIGLTDVSWTLYGLVYDCLHAVGDDLGSTPNLALSSEIAEDYEPYGSVWEYEITPNARWHDGEPLTVDDVVFTVNLNADFYVEMWAYQPYSYFIDYAETVPGDPGKVRVHFYDRITEEPLTVAFGDSLYMFVFPKHLLEGLTPADISFNWLGVFEGTSPPLVGSGPFMATEDIFDEFLSGDRITLVKNPYYHWALDRNLQPRFDRIELHFFSDSYAMTLALEDGDIDVAQFPRESYLTIKDKVDGGNLPNVETYDGPTCRQYFTNALINMNDMGPNPSRLDPIIRQAMAMATDKQHIVDTLFYGLAEEGSTLVAPVNEEWHYEPSETEIYDYNLTEAEELLEAGGYRYTPESPTVRVCTADSYAVQEGLVAEGTNLTYDMMIRVGYPEELHIAQYLQETWALIGIDLDYRVMTEPALGAEVYTYNYDTAIWYWASDPDPCYILFCESKLSWSGWNDNLYSTPEYEENFTLAVSSLNYAERRECVDNCQRLHYLDVAYIIFAYPHQTYAYRTDTVDGWGDWDENPGMSIDAFWGGNPFYFEPVVADYYEPLTTAELSGERGEEGWYTSDVTVALDASVVLVDVEPPTTSAVIHGSEGENGWYVSKVNVTLSAEDRSGEVESTQFSLDGSPMTEYSGEIPIEVEGVHVLEYFSEDDSGNVENTRSCTIGIDWTDPVVEILEDDGAEFNSSEVVIEFDCDDDVSGIDWCLYSLDGGVSAYCEPPHIGLHGVENGEHTIVVIACDAAGNTAADTLEFVVDAPEIVASRSVDYAWSDMFAHPFGSWWETRSETYGWEHALTDEYPYLMLYENAPPGNDWIKSFMRLNITGRDMTELNMLSSPEFLPIFSETYRGGTAVIDWYMNYMTDEEAGEKLPPILMTWYDGYFIAWNGTVLLDETAAKTVLDLTSSQFDSFNAWWAANGDSVAQDWEDWLVTEAGPDRLSIWYMYEWDLQFLLFDMAAEKTDSEHILLTFDTVSWGMEALMTRWMHEAFMPTEWWFEDMDFHAVIGPHMTDIDFDAAVAYSVVAYESLLDGTPCWTWQAMLQDCVPAPSEEYPEPLFEQYMDLTYLNRAPGNEWYGESLLYHYTPGAWNLSENETLTFEWPEGEQLFVVHDPSGTGEGLIDYTTNLTANMTARYVMPMPFDDPHAVSIDDDARQITFTGPFDMWTWSKEQTSHQYLADEWERLDVLPFGIPYIEFTADIESVPLEMDMDGPPSAVLVDEAVAFVVTVVNSTSEEIYADYDGTVTFMSSDPTAVLPADYTFVPGVDGGSHEFAVTFTTAAGYDDPHWLTVHDVNSSYLMAAADDIAVLLSVSVHTSSLGDMLMATAPPTIDSTMYRIDDGSWVEYVSPFVISDEGVHAVDFYSVDSNGTIEETKSVTVKIDKTAPELAFVTANGTVFTNSSVEIEWECSDAVSGVDWAEYCVDGGEYVRCASVSRASLVNISDGTHALSVRVYDDAGHFFEGEIVFSVSVAEQPDDDDNLLGPLSALEVAALAAAVVASALVAAFFLLRRRGGPPEADVGEQEPHPPG